MKTFAQLLTHPDQPDDNTVIGIHQADEMWELPSPDAVTWITVEVTEATGEPQIGDRYEGGKFVRLPE